MSLIGITSGAAHSVLPPVSFHNHSQKKGSGLAAESDASGIGQLPVGAGQSLLSGVIQALQHTIGASAATGSTTSAAVGGATGVAAGGTATNGGSSAVTAGANAGTGQAVSGFLHALFAALRADGSGSAQTATAASGAASATAGGASHYTGSLESSLQTLIQHLGSAGATTPTTANLNTSFANLVNAIEPGAGAASTAAGTSHVTGASTATGTATGSTPATASTAQLQAFLSNFLQQLQTPGLHAPSLVGSNVNANV